jgi:hypothetical protein
LLKSIIVACREGKKPGKSKKKPEKSKKKPGKNKNRDCFILPGPEYFSSRRQLF